MTPMLSLEAFAALGAPQLVYVRPIKAAEILASVPLSQIQGIELDPEQTLFAVHRADGERLAVMTDKESAVAAARAPERARVSVHLAARPPQKDSAAVRTAALFVWRFSI